MGRLLLIRHAQASFLEQNYERLSAVGETQARRLGQYWARQKILFDGVCSGPRVRHKQTAKIVAAIYRDAGIRFPEPVEIPEFDEYQAEAVLKQGLPRLVESNDEVRKLQQAFQNSSSSARLANFERMFEMLITKWVEGEVVLPGDHPCRRPSALLNLIVESLFVGVDVFVREGPQAELQVFDFLAECEIHVRSLRFRSNFRHGPGLAFRD
jgi:hypothetical protein